MQIPCKKSSPLASFLEDIKSTSSSSRETKEEIKLSVVKLKEEKSYVSALHPLLTRDLFSRFDHYLGMLARAGADRALAKLLSMENVKRHIAINRSSLGPTSGIWQHAIFSGNLAVITLLSKFYIDAVDHGGRTVLHWVFHYLNQTNGPLTSAILKILLPLFPKLLLQSRDNRYHYTPFHAALRANAPLDMLKALTEAGASIDFFIHTFTWSRPVVNVKSVLSRKKTEGHETVSAWNLVDRRVG